MSLHFVSNFVKFCQFHTNWMPCTNIEVILSQNSIGFRFAAKPLILFSLRHQSAHQNEKGKELDTNQTNISR